MAKSYSTWPTRMSLKEKQRLSLIAAGRDQPWKKDWTDAQIARGSNEFRTEAEFAAADKRREASQKRNLEIVKKERAEEKSRDAVIRARGKAEAARRRRAEEKSNEEVFEQHARPKTGTMVPYYERPEDDPRFPQPGPKRMKKWSPEPRYKKVNVSAATKRQMAMDQASTAKKKKTTEKKAAGQATYRAEYDALVAKKKKTTEKKAAGQATYRKAAGTKSKAPAKKASAARPKAVPKARPKARPKAVPKARPKARPKAVPKARPKARPKAVPRTARRKAISGLPSSPKSKVAPKKRPVRRRRTSRSVSSR
jgi:hypothetical protein